jgi:hypothetical protein
MITVPVPALIVEKLFTVSAVSVPVQALAPLHNVVEQYNIRYSKMKENWAVKGYNKTCAKSRK